MTDLDPVARRALAEGLADVAREWKREVIACTLRNDPAAAYDAAQQANKAIALRREILGLCRVYRLRTELHRIGPESVRLGDVDTATKALETQCFAAPPGRVELPTNGLGNRCRTDARSGNSRCSQWSVYRSCTD